MMLNRRGQTLIAFVLLIPLLVGVTAFVVDTGLVISEKIHLKEVTKTVIRDTIKSPDEEKIRKLLQNNDIDVDNLKVEIGDNFIIINNEIEVESIFGAIIGFREYKIKIAIQGRQENNKLIFNDISG